MDLPLLDGDTFEASRAKLAALDKADKERVEKETALNELQSFNFDLGDKIYQEDHEAASTEAEREAIQAEVYNTISMFDEHSIHCIHFLLGEQGFRLAGRGSRD